jgi:hypothetical protein
VWAGFPHSDICGSKLVCQLPAAFRRLPRPSSPVIAKASTACTYSLDPITVSTLRAVVRFMLSGYRLSQSRLLGCRARFAFCLEAPTSIQSSNPAIGSLRHARPRTQIAPRADPSVNGSNRFTSSSLLKNSRLTSITRSQNSVHRLRPLCPLSSDL